MENTLEFSLPKRGDFKKSENGEIQWSENTDGKWIIHEIPESYDSDKIYGEAGLDPYQK